MDERTEKLLSLLSMTPASRNDICLDLGITGAELNERIEAIRKLGISIDETLHTVRIAHGSWAAAKQLLAEQSKGAA